MTETVLQFVVGAVLFWLSLWLDFEDVKSFVEACFPSSTRWQVWLEKMARIALRVIAAACLLDPLIPGYAQLTITVPTEPRTFPTLLEHLRVRVIPAGILGLAGGDRTEYAAFDSNGSAEVFAKMTFLETTVVVQVYDQTRPSELLKSTTVYVSPFVRQRLIAKTIAFSERRSMKAAGFALATILCFAFLNQTASRAEAQMQILSPRANSVVPGEVVELTGIGADPAGTLEVEVLTNDWYLQDGKARINSDRTWTYSPVHLAGKGSFNNHTIRVTQIKDGQRGKSITVTGIVRKQ